MNLNRYHFTPSPAGVLRARKPTEPMPYKCERSEIYRYDENGITPKTFQVSLAELRRKRTIQVKIVEYMIVQMFPKKSIFALVDVLFKDMNLDH